MLSVFVTSLYWFRQPNVAFEQRLVVLGLGFVLGILPYVFTPRKTIVDYVIRHKLKEGEHNPKLTPQGFVFGLLGVAIYGIADAQPALFGIIGMSFLSLSYGFVYFDIKYTGPELKARSGNVAEKGD